MKNTILISFFILTTIFVVSCNTEARQKQREEKLRKEKVDTLQRECIKDIMECVIYFDLASKDRERGNMIGCKMSLELVQQKFHELAANLLAMNLLNFTDLERNATLSICSITADTFIDNVFEGESKDEIKKTFNLLFDNFRHKPNNNLNDSIQ